MIVSPLKLLHRRRSKNGPEQPELRFYFESSLSIVDQARDDSFPRPCFEVLRVKWEMEKIDFIHGGTTVFVLTCLSRFACSNY